MIQLESGLSALKIEIMLTAYHLASSKRHYNALCEKTATFKYDVGDGWESKDKGLRIILNAES